MYVTISQQSPRHEENDTTNVFGKTKTDFDVIIIARRAISEIQLHSTFKSFLVGSHSNKRGPPYSQQQELNIRTDTLAERSQTELPSDMKPRDHALHFT
jgi:hypothetical protein